MEESDNKDKKNFLIRGHNWVFTMHIIIGPLLAAIAYLGLNKCEEEFSEYKSFINGLLTAQVVIGIVVAIYHGYRLFKGYSLSND